MVAELLREPELGVVQGEPRSLQQYRESLLPDPVLLSCMRQGCTREAASQATFQNVRVSWPIRWSQLRIDAKETGRPMLSACRYTV